MNASPITKITSWLEFLGKNLQLVGCATVCVKSEVMLVCIKALESLCKILKINDLSTFVRVGAAMTTACSIGAVVFPNVIGHLILLHTVYVWHIYWWENHAV